MRADRLALFTTVYPAAERYLGAWYASVLAQEDRDVDLWVGVDGLTRDQVCAAFGAEPAATWVMGEAHDSPTRIRTRAIERMVRDYDGIIFVDSDDLLHPSRVAAARSALLTSDVSACALHIMDEHGQDAGITFSPRAGDDAAALLPRYNVFGLSNTAYRTDVLARCLPVPADAALVDWLLATRAWAAGARLTFDHAPRMSYRQYAANIARVVQPFEPRHVLAAADRVVEHYRFALAESVPLAEPYREAVRRAGERAETFQRAMHASSETLDRYVRALNEVTPAYVWWWCVAHPDLEDVWRN